MFSKTWNDHLLHLETVLTKLQDAQLTLQLAKCVFAAPSCDFLGHHVAEGISPQKAKTASIENFQQPKTKKDVRSFLGLVSYYRRYIPNFSAISSPLSDLTKNRCRPDIIEWTDACQKAFTTLKQLLTSHPILAPPNYDLPFLLYTMRLTVVLVLCYRKVKGNKNTLSPSTLGNFFLVSRTMVLLKKKVSRL